MSWATWWQGKLEKVEFNVFVMTGSSVVVSAASVTHSVCTQNIKQKQNKISVQNKYLKNSNKVRRIFVFEMFCPVMSNGNGKV